jgi:hypothetical protein
MKRILFLFLILFNYTINAQTQPKKPVQENLVQTEQIPRYRVKLSLIDQSIFSLPLIKAQGEYMLGFREYPRYLALDLGYNYYSYDERVRTSGYHLGLRINQYRNSLLNAHNWISYGVFYQNTVVNDYLKVSRSIPGLGEYSEYQKMKYNKVRYGINLEFLKEYNLVSNLFFEIGIGSGVMIMRTITPNNVSQETFVNGVYREKNVGTPMLTLSMKLGYKFF